jgi:hypothetical protein
MMNSVLITGALWLLLIAACLDWFATHRESVDRQQIDPAPSPPHSLSRGVRNAESAALHVRREWIL